MEINFILLIFICVVSQIYNPLILYLEGRLWWRISKSSNCYYFCIKLIKIFLHFIFCFKNITKFLKVLIILKYSYGNFGWRNFALKSLINTLQIFKKFKNTVKLVLCLKNIYKILKLTLIILTFIKKNSQYAPHRFYALKNISKALRIFYFLKFFIQGIFEVFKNV